MLRRAKTTFESRGYEVETLRIATQPFPEYTKGMSTQQTVAFFQKYDALAEKENHPKGNEKTLYIWASDQAHKAPDFLAVIDFDEESADYGKVIKSVPLPPYVYVGDWREMVEQHPLRALGMALGAGYVVGGGLLSPLTGRILYGALRVGFRLAALPLVRDELMTLLETATDRGRGETERRQQ